jgi:hypothetical protein
MGFLILTFAYKRLVFSSEHPYSAYSSTTMEEILILKKVTFPHKRSEKCLG